MQENELVILWTSGVKKTQIVHLFFLFSIIVTIFHIIFSVIITPLALNKSRQLLSNENLSSILPTFRIQQFSDSFKGLTFIVDDKFENEITNIFLHDSSNILQNISVSKETDTSSTIIAKSGIIEEKKMILFNGLIISSNNKNESDIIKFEQIDIDLKNITNNTIKKPKIQETSTVKLVGCLNNNYFNDINCKGGFKEEILPTLSRRIIMPLFIPVITLIASLLLIKSKNKYFYSKVGIFSYAFLILLYAELAIPYTGLNKIFANIFIISPLILSVIIYTFIQLKLSRESKFNE
jgi:lipopolysaccharide export system permease protein